jgi:hypothetical protein
VARLGRASGLLSLPVDCAPDGHRGNAESGERISCFISAKLQFRYDARLTRAFSERRLRDIEEDKPAPNLPP